MSKIVESVQKHISLLVEICADRFDPVRFCYIKSLIRRSEEKTGIVNKILEQKAFDALADYQYRLDHARMEASDIVADISSRYPDSAGKIKKLFEECDFKGIKRLSARIDRSNRRVTLLLLTNQISKKKSAWDENDVSFFFDDLLQQQEDEVIQSFNNSLAADGFTQNRFKIELKSCTLLKKTWAKLCSDMLVTNSIKELPENPGPLNEQMLATRTLSTMRDLSSDYLNRFVSYIDTLLWLEQALENIKTVNSIKGNRRSNSNSIKRRTKVV